MGFVFFLGLGRSGFVSDGDIMLKYKKPKQGYHDFLAN